MFSLFSVFTLFLFNLGKYVNWCEKISFSLLYLTLVTSRKICPFLCCHLLYLIIYLKYTNPTNLFIQHNRMSSYLYKIFVLLNSSWNASLHFKGFFFICNLLIYLNNWFFENIVSHPDTVNLGQYHFHLLQKTYSNNFKEQSAFHNHKSWCSYIHWNP